jgi:hypothetical protein
MPTSKINTLIEYLIITVLMVWIVAGITLYYFGNISLTLEPPRETNLSFFTENSQSKNKDLMTKIFTTTNSYALYQITKTMSHTAVTIDKKAGINLVKKINPYYQKTKTAGKTAAEN